MRVPLLDLTGTTAFTRCCWAPSIPAHTFSRLSGLMVYVTGSTSTNTGSAPSRTATSERAARETLALAIYPELTHVQQEYVVDRLATFYRDSAETR